MEGAEFSALSPVFGVPEFQTVSWIVCLGIAAAWMQGFALGGNGAANDFSTTVGAGVLSLKQAMVTAAVFDCAGALTLGVGVSKTIASKIADVNHFQTIPTLYMVRVGHPYCSPTFFFYFFPSLPLLPLDRKVLCG